MNQGTNIAELISSKAGNDIKAIEKIVDDYPISALSHYLHLYQLKKNKDPQFEQSLKNAALYFNNPHWLQFQLDQSVLEDNNLETTLFENTVENKEIHEDISDAIAENVLDQSELEDNNLETTSPEYTVENKEIHEDIPGAIAENVEPSDSADLIRMDQEDEDEINHFPTEKPEEEFMSSIMDDEKNIQLHEHDTAGLTGTEETEMPGKELREEPIESVLENRDQINDFNPVIDGEQPTNSGAEEEKISITYQASNLNDSSLTGDNEESLTFEPLHTVDYFASQGIKISDEGLRDDKLGKQVKSFTAWLKSMKTLHPEKMPEQNEVIEKIIQSSAEESNTGADILTEAMAEVLLKQNKREKAVEMYLKLSLMNPSKSAYFAGKIESLKTN